MSLLVFPSRILLFAGIDMLFVRTALDLTENAVYSLHKTSTREVRNTCIIFL